MKKRNALKAMYLCLSIIMCMPQLQYAKTTRSKSAPGTAIFVMAPTKDSVFVRDHVLNYQSDSIKIDMHIPQFENLSNQEFQKKLNKTLLKSAAQRKKEVIKLTETYHDDMAKDGLTNIPFEYIETFSIIPSTYPYFTVELYQYQYSGGAHGISELKYINLDIEQNRLVCLKDLFKESVDYVNVINQLVQQEIERRQLQGEFFFMGSDGFQTIRPNHTYFINKYGDLVIVFNVYEIAPYASGAIFILLPATSITSYLK